MKKREKAKDTLPQLVRSLPILDGDKSERRAIPNYKLQMLLKTITINKKENILMKIKTKEKGAINFNEGKEEKKEKK